LLDSPPNQWLRIEIVTGLGAQATGTWDLTVTLPGKPPQRFSGLKNGSSDWRQLDWLGVCSNAKQKTVFHLDNIALGNEPK
jgi:hypothetical protein